MGLHKMEAVIYNQDLYRYICGYLNTTDTLNMTEINKEINQTTKSILPKYYAKLLHLKNLKKKYNFYFLQDCVQTNLQAELLYKSYSETYMSCISPQFTGKMRKIYNLVRFKNWKRKGHPSTHRINKKLKLLQVL